MPTSICCVASRTFARLDAFLATPSVAEIAGKRFAHKRAFVRLGCMVEIVLVDADSAGYFTNYWGTTQLYWPVDAFAGGFAHPVCTVSPSALRAARVHWRDRPSYEQAASRHPVVLARDPPPD